MFRSYKDIKRSSSSSETAKQRQKELYKCEWCSEGWQSESDVYIHATRAHDKEIADTLAKGNENVCRMCLAICKDKQALLRHIRCEHLLSSEGAPRVEREIFICDHCSQLFFNKQLLAVHMCVVHKYRRRDERMQCARCSKAIRLLAMWSHFERHRIQSVSCCPICLTKCEDKKTLRLHVGSHERYYMCAMCRHAPRTAAAHAQHAEGHRKTHGMTKRPRHRSMARYFVPSGGPDLRLHWKLGAFRGLSLSNQVRICVMCREICTGDREMLQHILDHKNHTVDNKVVYTCSCGVEFSNKILLKLHVFKTEGEGHSDASAAGSAT